MNTLTWINVPGAIAPALGLLALFVRLAVRHEVTLRATGSIRVPRSKGGPRYFFELENQEDRRFVDQLELTFSVQHQGGRIAEIALEDEIARRATTEIDIASRRSRSASASCPPGTLAHHRDRRRQGERHPRGPGHSGIPSSPSS